MEIRNGVAILAKTDEIDLAAMRTAMVDVVEIELIRPLEVGGEERTTLTFEEPTGRHVERMSKAVTPQKAAEVSLAVLGECVGLSPDEVKKMRSRDLSRLSQVLEYFLPAAPLSRP